MDILHCGLLPFATADGPRQMAADEVLLATAAGGTASLRFYAWSPPTLSLGYFQPAAARLADPRLAGLPWVRRATGGEALVHDQELTYALALPSGPPWQTRSAPWTLRLHQALRAALADFGIAVELALMEERAGEFLCFLHATPGDLLLNGAKIAGSAQRKRRGALLQHGGVLLGRSPFTPALPGIAELTGKTLAAAELVSRIIAQLQRDTGWHVGRSMWSEAEQCRIAELAVGRYQSPAWNEKR